MRSAPYIIGHEVSGTIVDMGEGPFVKDFGPGDRVTGCFYNWCGRCKFCERGIYQKCENLDPRTEGMAEYLVWNEKQIFKVPDQVSLAQASLTEPIAVCLDAVSAGNIQPGQGVLIFGGGACGLLITQLARARGANPVVVVEPLQHKRELALELGADYAIDPYRGNLYKELTILSEAMGFHTVIECSGSRDAIDPAFEMVGDFGTLIVFSALSHTFTYPLRMLDFYNKNAIVRSVYLARESAFLNALQTIPRLRLDKYTDHIVPIDEYEYAFSTETLRNFLKVIIKIG